MSEHVSAIRPRRRTLIWACATLAVLVGLYALAGFVLLPRFARQALTQYVEHELKGHVSLGALSFNPFTLHAEMRQFALSGPDGAPLASFERLQVTAALSSLWRGATLRTVQLERPALELVVDRGGTLNWMRLMPPAASSSGGAAAASKPSPQVRIQVLRLQQGRVHFEDRSRAQPFSTVLDPIEFELLDFRTAPDHSNRLQLSARTTAGEGFELGAEFSLQPLRSTGSLRLSNLQIATLTSYLQDALPFRLPSGALDARATYRWSTGAAAAESLTLEQLSIRNLTLAPRAVAEATNSPWITLPQIELTGAQVDLAARRIEISRLALHAPAVRAWRNADGTLSLQQLFGAANPQGATNSGAASAATGAGAAAAAPWVLALRELSMDGGSLEMEDRSVTPFAALRLGAVGLTLQNYSSDKPEQPIAFKLTTRVGDSGQVSAQGDLALSGPRAAAQLEVQQLDLTALQPYLTRQTNLSLYRGNLSAKAHASYDPARADGPKLDITGSVKIANLATRERLGNSELVNWQLLELDGVRYQQQPDSLRIEQIALRRAYGRVLISANGDLNIAQVLRPQGAAGQPAPDTGSSSSARRVRAPSAKSAKSAAAAPGAGHAPSASSASSTSSAASASMPIRIDRIEISGSTANFTDQSVRPTFSAAILDLGGSVVGLSSAAQSRAQVHLSGQVDRYAPVSITGELNPLATMAYTDLTLSFRNIDLTIFNPYSGKFAGYSIAQGKLATQMHYHVENRKLQASHHVVIDQLEFGPATANKPAVPLPIKLAVAVLKDRHGVITLDLPVSGSIDDPQFRLGPLIGKALLGLLTKIVTAPFSWLGSLFAGGEQLAYVDFAAGSVELADADRQKIAKLADALSERPQLRLEVPLHTESSEDDRVLAQQALQQAVDAQEQRALSASAASRTNRGQRAGGGTQSKRDANAAAEAPVPPRRLALEALYQAQFHAAPSYPADVDASPPAAANVTASAATGAAPDAQADARTAWLARQLLPKFAPTEPQRTALGRARADAVEEAVLAGGKLSAERVFLVDRPSGGGPPGTVRMQLQLQ